MPPIAWLLLLSAPQGQHLVALGDFGSGDGHQAAVSKAIALRHGLRPFDFGITLGDNFYRCGVKSVRDPIWKTRWEDHYAALGIEFFAALGNHDYGHPPIICPGSEASPDAEVAYTRHSNSWRMPSRYYTFAKGAARFFAIDTEGWSATQAAWLSKALLETLDEPGVHWRIVYGHHPMHTSGVHLNERRIGALRRELSGLFKQSKVDLYLAGHDHDMEHLLVDGVHYLINGAGGAHLRRVREPRPGSLFHASVNGFLELTIDGRSLAASFLDVNLASLENPELRLAK